MKMTKKILIGAVAAAAMAFSFTGCDILGDIMSGDSSLSKVFMKQYGTENVIDYSDNDSESNGRFQMNDNVKEEGDKIDGYTNASETDMVRSMRFFQTKKHGTEGVVTLKPNATKSADGVIGVVFGANVNEDEEGNELDTMNFGLVGIRVSGGQVGYYVSYFANVKSEDLGKSNFGTNVTKDKVDPKTTTSYEIRFQPKSGDAYKVIDGLALDADGQVQVYLEVEEDKSTGDYTVNLYKVSKAAKDGDAIASVKVPAADLNREYGKTVCGCYANVYPGRTLTASFEVM